MTVVVKIGGARAVDPEGALSDVAALVAEGEDVVLTHGGSTAVDETLEELGEERPTSRRPAASSAGSPTRTPWTCSRW